MSEAIDDVISGPSTVTEVGPDGVERDPLKPTGEKMEGQMGGEPSGGTQVGNPVMDAKAMPHGSLCMKELHQRLLHCKSHMAQQGPMIDNPKVKRHMGRMHENIHRIMDMNRDMHKSIYPEHHDEGDWQNEDDMNKTPGEQKSVSGLSRGAAEGTFGAKNEDTTSPMAQTATRHGLNHGAAEGTYGRKNEDHTEIPVTSHALLKSHAEWLKATGTSLHDHGKMIDSLMVGMLHGESNAEAGAHPQVMAHEHPQPGRNVSGEAAMKSAEGLSPVEVNQLFEAVNGLAATLNGVESQLKAG